MSKKRLARSTDQWLAGVCGGVAEFVGWEPGIVRMLWVLGTVLSFGIGGVVVYAVMALVMPPPSESES